MSGTKNAHEFKERTFSGTPIPGHSATAADAIAALSRVNYSQVIRVFCALNALRTHLGLPPDPLTDIGDAPKEAVREGEEKRWEATERMAYEVACNPDTQTYRGMLYYARWKLS